MAEKHWCEIGAGSDYLTTRCPHVDLLVCNPPFSLALEFLGKSLAEASTVAYPLRINFLASQKLYAWWNDNKPDHLLVISKRPRFDLSWIHTQAAWLYSVEHLTTPEVWPEPLSYPSDLMFCFGLGTVLAVVE